MSTREHKKGKNRGLEYNTDPVAKKAERVARKKVRQAHHHEDLDDEVYGIDFLDSKTLDHIK